MIGNGGGKPAIANRLEGTGILAILQSLVMLMGALAGLDVPWLPWIVLLLASAGVSQSFRCLMWSGGDDSFAVVRRSAKGCARSDGDHAGDIGRWFCLINGKKWPEGWALRGS